MTRRAIGVASIESLSDADLDDIRVVARLYQVVDRNPVFATALEYVLSSILEHFEARAPSRLIRALVSCLLVETGAKFDGIGYEERGNVARSAAVRMSADGADTIVLVLLIGIANPKRLHDLKPLAVDAILRALTVAVEDTSPRVDRARVFAAVAWAAFTTGNIHRLSSATMQLTAVAPSPGYQAVARFFESRLAEAASDPARFDEALRAFQDIAVKIRRSDPAYSFVSSVAALEAAMFDPVAASVLDRAAVAIRQKRWVEAADLYERSIAAVESPTQRAAFRIFSEIARAQTDPLDNSAAITACLDRLVYDDILAARLMLDVEPFLMTLLTDALSAHRVDDHNSPCVRIVDLLGEYRGGAAVGHGAPAERFTGDALADLTLNDLMAGHGEAMTAEQARRRFPEHVLVWVNLLNSDVGWIVVTCTLIRATSTPAIRRTVLAPSRQAMLAGLLGERAEQADPSQIAEISQLIFADLPPAEQGYGIVVIPDLVVWDMPWLQLAPREATEIILAASAASAARLRPIQPHPRPRVIGIFDLELTGARTEMAKLGEFAAAGVIDFTSVGTLGALSDALHSSSFEVLTVGVHGTTGDGFEYRLLLPDRPSSPAGLLRMPLPSVVVLGSCWSATSAVRQDAVAAALACLSAGASQVVGGLWAIDDAVAGDLLSRMYQSYFAGVPLARALLAAHHSLKPEHQLRAAGLTVIGRP